MVKIYPLVKSTAKYIFSGIAIGNRSIKTAVSVSCVQFHCPYANLVIFGFKNVFKNVALNIVLLVLKACC